MEYAIILTGIVLLSVVGIFFFKSNKKDNEQNTSLQVKESNIMTESTSNELAIKFDMLPAETTIDENKLVEIKDKKVIARVVDAVPELAQSGVSIRQAIKESSKILYEAKIPIGANLVDSKDMAGAVRGFYRGTDGIRGHANLVQVDNSANALANATSSAMNVASMVVGQYYMSQINEQLEGITNKISQITDFQDNEFMSKVFALVSQIKIMSEFQTEIMDNNELRTSELIKLDTFEHECAELLGQANKTISDFASKRTESYNDYENTCISLQKWVLYQKTLLEVLNKIAELKFAMRLGTLSIEQCGSLLNTYITQSEQATAMLTAWHENELKSYEVHLDESTRKRDGIDGVIHKIPAMFNEEYAYKSITENVVNVIQNQIASFEKPKTMSNDKLFESDVRMIVKEGKLYYLPDNK